VSPGIVWLHALLGPCGALVVVLGMGGGCDACALLSKATLVGLSTLHVDKP
jgi:hypothetical protein